MRLDDRVDYRSQTGEILRGRVAGGTAHIEGLVSIRLHFIILQNHHALFDGEVTWCFDFKAAMFPAADF